MGKRAEKLRSAMIDIADHHLASNETVLARLHGRNEVNNLPRHAVLTATDTRVILVTKVNFSMDSKTLPWNRITGIERKTGLLIDKSLTLSTPTENVELLFPEGDIDGFMDVVNRKIAPSDSE